MELLKKSLNSFERLKEIKYRLVLSSGKTNPLEIIVLSFIDEDWFHILGLQHLSDLDLPKSKKILIDYVKKDLITDEYLYQSEYFDNDSLGYNIKRRIEMACFLEDYLDSDDFAVAIFKLQHDKRTYIQADYLITCKKSCSDEEYYIFIRKRKEESTYGIVSCFPRDKVAYWGGRRYLMLKEKTIKDNKVMLFKHPKYFT